MLIPLIFKNNDTDDRKTKIGKVNSILARMIYSFTLSKKVGILEGYGNEMSIKSTAVGNFDTVITFNKGAFSVYGGIVLIEQDTEWTIPNVTNGSIGVEINLNEEPGYEVCFYAGDNPPASRDNLQDNETQGVYYFEIYRYSVTGGTFTQLSKTTQKIKSNANLGDILDGTIAVPKANVIVPSATTSNSVSFYVGENLVKLEW